MPVAAQPGTEALRLSELLSALSHALDLTEGQPEGHCVRCCWIGTALGREIGLSEPELWELYYTLLLKDVGCSADRASGAGRRRLQHRRRPPGGTRRDRRRAGTWFDPALAAKFVAAEARPGFWETLAAPEHEARILELEPARRAKTLDEGFLDDIAEAFAQVVDSKSPYTSGHSSRVADITDRIAAELGFTPARRRWLRRGALLHDIGKLGVSNTILDKPGKLTPAEWKAMRHHAFLTEGILSRISAFGELARVAGAHHERLDGKGYPHGLHRADIALETRVLTTADIFDALTAKRPYRDALSEVDALEIMAGDVGTAIDVGCFAALKAALAKRG